VLLSIIAHDPFPSQQVESPAGCYFFCPMGSMEPGVVF